MRMATEPAAADSGQRAIRASLGAGLFTNGIWDMLSVAVPLYAVAVGLNVAEIGLVVAARSLLPALLSIHGGILMDQLGTRRVLLWVAVGSTLLPLLYPLSGWFVVLIALQLLLGLATGLGMAASQTWSMQTSRGDTVQLARYSVVTRVGTFLGPVIVGAVWDLFGAWAAFTSLALCGAGIVAAAVHGIAGAAEQASPTAEAPRLASVLVPQWATHKQALALAVIPTVAFVLAVSFLRNASGAIQSSVYVVYLNGLGMSGTLIGTLVALTEFFGVFGSMAASRLERWVRPDRLVMACIAVSVVAISATPLIASSLALLIAACAMRGFSQGVSQPLMYSILSHAVPATRHGAAVGLRNATVRLASIVTPAIMGFAAEAWGIEASFYAVGVGFLLATATLAVATRGSVSRLPVQSK